MKKTLKATIALAGAAVLAVAALAGCSSGATTSASTADQPLTVAYLNKAGYETIMVADKQGYFQDAGDITLSTVTGSGQQSVEALLGGSADIAATGQGPVADALGQYGDDIVVLCGTNCNTDSQVIVAGPSMTGKKAVTPYDKSSDNAAEVKESFEAAAEALGHPIRLGVQQGATTESAVKSWLTKMDISVNDFDTDGDGTVQLVNVQANTLPTTLAAGKDIDMMAASQPYPDTAINSVKGSYRVGSNADTNSYDVACYITTKEIYEQKEDSIKEFVKALDQATDYMADSANTEACIDLCTDYMGVDRETVESAFELADWKTTLSDTMIDSISKAVTKRGYDMTRDQVIEHCPLMDWMNSELGN